MKYISHIGSSERNKSLQSLITENMEPTFGNKRSHLHFILFRIKRHTFPLYDIFRTLILLSEA